MTDNQTEPEVRVVFRKHNEDKQIFALFPDEPHDWDGFYCISYAHIGQHSAAKYTLCVNNSVPAKEEEYASLKEELESEPYNYKLRVVKKCQPKHYQEARKYRQQVLAG